MKNNKENIRKDKFITTSSAGITIIKKADTPGSEENKEPDIDFDNIPWEGANYHQEINYDDVIDMAELKGSLSVDKHETHPFKPFVPAGASVLILGSFPGKNANTDDDWYYSAKRNQFWKIISSVYSVEYLQRVEDKKQLFEKAGIAIADIILIAERSKGGNLDSDLIIIKDNKEAIEAIINYPGIKKVFFTSHFVEKMFLSLFPWYQNGEYLPSPSPIYRQMSINKKIETYAEKLPKL